MQTAKGKVVEGARIIVPAAFRRSLGLEKGDTVLIELHGDELRVRPARAALRRLQATLRALASAEGRVSDELIAGRSAEMAREDGDTGSSPQASVIPAPDADASADGGADRG